MKILSFLFVFILSISVCKAEKVSRVYVSSSQGNDNNTGLSMDDPVASLDKASRIGKDLYLKAGDVFYGNMLVRNRTITRYGEGVNPIVSGFRRFTGSDWQKVAENVWKINLTTCHATGMWIPEESSFMNNVGSLHEYDKDIIHGKKVQHRKDLKEDWDIWQTECFDKDTPASAFDELYLYLSEDPNKLKLEFSIGATGMTVYNGTLDGITITGFGLHGVSGHSNTIVRNCKIDAIGGELFLGYKYFVCLGNGVEFCVTEDIKDCLVENCLISRCYDCGASIQGAGSGQATPRNILFRNNLIENCCQGWEDYLCNDDNVKYENCRFSNNVVLNCGNTSGFGYPVGRVKFCNVLGTNEKGDRGMIIEKNVFVGGNLYCSTSYNDQFKSNKWGKNKYYTTRGTWLLKEASTQKVILYVPAAHDQGLVVRFETWRVIRQYRKLTGDRCTRFFFLDELELKKLLLSEKECFLEMNPNLR